MGAVGRRGGGKSATQMRGCGLSSEDRGCSIPENTSYLEVLLGWVRSNRAGAASTRRSNSAGALASNGPPCAACRRTRRHQPGARGHLTGIGLDLVAARSTPTPRSLPPPPCCRAPSVGRAGISFRLRQLPALRQGNSPCLLQSTRHPRRQHEQDGSNTSSVAVMQTRSRTLEMPSGLSLPLAFGINTRLMGSGR